MKYVKSQFATVGFGACMGMPGFLLAVGEKVAYFLILTPCDLFHPEA